MIHTPTKSWQVKQSALNEYMKIRRPGEQVQERQFLRPIGPKNSHKQYSKKRKKEKIKMSVKLVSNDNQEFLVNKEIACFSKLVESMMENDDEDDNSQEEEIMEIPLPRVSSKDLKKVLEFLEYRKDHKFDEIDKPILSQNMENNLEDPWYAKFIDVKTKDLVGIMEASNFMDIEDLMNLSCAKMASLIKERTNEELDQLEKEIEECRQEGKLK